VVVDPSNDETLWDENELVRLSISDSESGVDIVCTHEDGDTEKGRYRFRITDPSLFQVGIANEEPTEVPTNVRRILGKNKFYDTHSPKPNRLHAYDYLCNYEVPISSSLSDRHPFLKVTGAALNASCIRYAQTAGIEASIVSEEWPSSLDELDTTGILSDSDSRIEVARTLVNNETIAEQATIPAYRPPFFINEITGDWPDEPPVTLSASSDYRKPNTPEVNLFSYTYENDTYYQGTVMSRYGFENYRFKVVSSEDRELSMEWPNRHEPRINQYPPLELVFELVGRSINITNIPYPTGSLEYVDILANIDKIVSDIEEVHPVKSSVVKSAQIDYRDLYGILLTLVRFCQHSDKNPKPILDKAAQKSNFPIIQIANSPNSGVEYFNSPDALAEITEEIADATDEFNDPESAAKSVKSLRWDPENLEDRES